MPIIRFNIIITSYNQRQFIIEAVDSALCQGKKAADVIVVDDASTDGSQEMLRQCGDAIRLVCFENNQGAGAARNHGAALATGEYLVFLDGDDVFLPWALDVYERIVKAKKPKMVLGRLGSFKGIVPALQTGDTPHEIRSVEFPYFLRRDRPLNYSASMLVIDRQSFAAAQGWSGDTWPSEDTDLPLRLGDCGRTIQILAPATVFHRVHGANAAKNVPHVISALLKIIHNEYAGEYPGGKRRSWERHAIIGRQVVNWTKRAAKARLYGSALKLLARGWSMALAAGTRKLGVMLKGRQPSETIDF